MQRRDRITLEKVISEMEFGIEILKDIPENEFMSDEVLKRALSMTVINVGELIKVVTDDLRKSNPEFPWKAVAGMRDVAAHRYQTLRMEDVYTTIKEEYPILKSELQSILSSENAGESG